MSEPFDPYRKWLGILPQELPPNHYRLLGIPPLENDADVIDHAASRQMAHVRTFQLGIHAAESQALLSQLAAARACLLNPQQKRDYDRRLASSLAASEKPTPAALPKALAAAAPVASPAALPVTKSPEVIIIGSSAGNSPIPSAAAMAATGPLVLTPPLAKFVGNAPSGAPQAQAANVVPPPVVKVKFAERWKTDGETPPPPVAPPLVPIPMAATKGNAVAAANTPRAATELSELLPTPWPVPAILRKGWLPIGLAAGFVGCLILSIVVVVQFALATRPGTIVAENRSPTRSKPIDAASTHLVDSTGDPGEIKPASNPATDEPFGPPEGDGRLPAPAILPETTGPTTAGDKPKRRLRKSEFEEQIRSAMFTTEQALLVRDVAEAQKQLESAKQLLDSNPNFASAQQQTIVQNMEAWKAAYDQFWQDVRKVALEQLTPGETIKFRQQELRFVGRVGEVIEYHLDGETTKKPLGQMPAKAALIFASHVSSAKSPTSFLSAAAFVASDGGAKENSAVWRAGQVAYRKASLAGKTHAGIAEKLGQPVTPTLQSLFLSGESE